MGLQTQPSFGVKPPFGEKSRSLAQSVITPFLGFSIQLSLMIGAVISYFAVRGVTEGSESIAIENGYEILAFEERLGLDIEEQMQNVVLTSQFLIDLSNWIYIWGHWPLITITLFWLFLSQRGEYQLLRNAMFISGGIGLIIFMIYPVAPPRLLDDVVVDTIAMYSESYRILQPPDLVNKYAAVPSLHVGWNLLIGIFIYRNSSFMVLRLFAILSPILMAIAVITTGNHFFIDGFVGSGVALTGYAIALFVGGYVSKRRQLKDSLSFNINSESPVQTVVRQESHP
jgi:hypothetical protein